MWFQAWASCYAKRWWWWVCVLLLSTEFTNAQSSNAGEPHLCQKLQDGKLSEVRLIAVTHANEMIYLIESDNIYPIPYDNIISKKNSRTMANNIKVKMYNIDNGKLLARFKWYKSNTLAFPQTVFNRNKPNELVALSIYHQNKVWFYHYRFNDKADYIYQKHGNKNKVNHYESWDKCIPYSAVSDQDHNGYIFYKPNDVQQVVVRPIVIDKATPHTINFPAKYDTKDQKEFVIELSDERISFLPNTNDNRQKTQLLSDLPNGFIYGNIVHMWDWKKQKVYQFPFIDLREESSKDLSRNINIASIKMSDYLVCFDGNSTHNFDEDQVDQRLLLNRMPNNENYTTLYYIFITVMGTMLMLLMVAIVGIIVKRRSYRSTNERERHRRMKSASIDYLQSQSRNRSRSSNKSRSKKSLTNVNNRQSSKNSSKTRTNKSKSLDKGKSRNEMNLSNSSSRSKSRSKEKKQSNKL